MKKIYLDNAATSYPKPESVYTAIDYFNRNMGGNPGRGSHSQTLQAGSILLETREALAELFNIKDSSQIAFTLNVTEALNTGLKGLLKAGDHVITSSMEHNAVARPLHILSQRGVEWTIVEAEQDGSIEPQDIKNAIQENTRMICILHASNLTGTILPIAEIGQIARDNGIIFMVDTAQSAGILDLDVERQNIDLLAFTGHKGLLGPQGTGGLYVRSGLDIKPLKEGGSGSSSESLEQPLWMPDRLESGTPNTPGIAGLLAGIQFIKEIGRDNILHHEQQITALLLDGLQTIPRVEIYGSMDSAQRTAVIAFNIEDMDCGSVSMQMEHQFGIITRSGLHCAPLAHQTLFTLERGTCRLSPGYFTSEDDIKQVLEAIHYIAHGK